jgi:transposase
VELVADLDGTAYIPYRANAQVTAEAVVRAPTWTKLFHLDNYRRDEFLMHYHLRSNAESTFSAVKRVFGDTLRSKTFAAQVNELLLKVIAHNIVCMVHSIFELGVTIPGLSACTQNRVAAHNIGV